MKGSAVVRWLAALLVVVACACASAGVPERPRFRIVGPAQGLPSTDIKVLARDRAGYLWIGTSDGLARYDGVGVRTWRYHPDATDGLPGNHIQALLVDDADRLWVAVEGGGVSVLDAARRRFTHFRKDNSPALESDDVWAMAQVRGSVWLGTYGGGLVHVAADGTMRRYGKEDGLPANTVLSLAADAGGVLWIGTPAGLARFAGGRIEPVSLPGAEGAAMVYVASVLPDGLWVGTSQGVWRLASGRWTQPDWSPMFQRRNSMLAVASGDRGDRWIGSQRGLWHQAGTGVPEPVAIGGPDIPRALDALIVEPGGGLWVPVAGRGLGYLRPDWRQIADFRGERDGLTGGLYRALAVGRNGGVWLAGLSGVIEHMDADGAVAQLDPDLLSRLATVKPAVIAEDRGGRLWLGSRIGLLRVGVDGSVDEWSSTDERDAAPDALVTQILPAPDGSLWFSAPGVGLQRRDPANGRVLEAIVAGPDGGLGDADIEAAVLDAGGTPWVAGSDGVLRKQGARFEPAAGIAPGRAFALAFDGPARLWVQRLSGLERYDLVGARWVRGRAVGIGQGIPAVAAASMVVDQRHRVWLTTSRGLFRWDDGRQMLRHIAALDADGSDEYLDRAAILRGDGVLVAATADGGLRMVDTTGADPSPHVASLRIDGAAVRRDGDWAELPLTGRLDLRREDRELRIRARLLAYDDPASNRYWSRLDGFDPDWVPVEGGERVFTGLAPGRYVVRMRARDAAGNLAREQVLQFHVPPPWWRAPWALAAWAALLLAMLAVAGWLYRQRLKRRHAWQLAEHKRELAEQASDAKSRFLATLGHEVRTPMTGVLGMAELLSAGHLEPRQRHQVDAIHRAGQHLLRLVNDALDLARIEAGRLELAEAAFPLLPLLDEVAALMAPMAERKGLAFVEDVAARTPTTVIGDRTRLQQILLNLVGNAIKFTETGHVALETGPLQPHGLRFRISDTGPGIGADQQQRLFRRFEQADGQRTAARYGGSGLGLAISQELAAAMGGAISVDSEPGAGTCFTVDLPLRAAGGTPHAVGPSPRHAPTPGASLQLLLVEDDPIVADVVSGLLQSRGHRVRHVGHGLAALAETATTRFDAALLDLDLPGMDGLALARALRAGGFPAPLVAVTARSDADAEAEARRAGFDRFLRKPVSGDLLEQALAGVRRPPSPAAVPHAP